MKPIFYFTTAALGAVLLGACSAVLGLGEDGHLAVNDAGPGVPEASSFDAPAQGDGSSPGTDADLGPDSGTDTGVVFQDLTAPRAIAPLSTARATSRHPTLHWLLAQGTDGARVEIFRDRACTQSVVTFDAAGSSGAPPIDLPQGIVYWRLRARASGAFGKATSPVWEVAVGPRSASIDASYGSIADFNGDGLADVAIGAPGANGGVGEVLVYSGAANVATAQPLVLTAEGHQRLGQLVVNVGDTNGDGYADLAVTDLCAAGTVDTCIYVHHGGPAGIAVTPSRTIHYKDPNFKVHSLAGGGDLDGDGYADLVFGDLCAGSTSNAGCTTTGSAFVFAGGPDGVRTSGASYVVVPPSNIGGGAAFGRAVAVGDMNGDGFADLAVGASCDPFNPSTSICGSGSVFVYFGSATGPVPNPVHLRPAFTGGSNAFGTTLALAGDVDGNGMADLLVSYGPVPHVAVYLGAAGGPTDSGLIALATPAGVGNFTNLAGGSDLDRDGFDDVVVGATCVLGDAGTCQSGAAFIYPGSLQGTSAASVASVSGAVSFGGAVATPGDIDGDGFDDLVVGTPGAANAAAAFRGVTAFPKNTPFATWTGKAGDSLGQSIAGR